MSFTLTDEQLNEMFDQIPTLSQQPRQIEELPGGLTNRNVRITVPDGEYVARCTDSSGDALGIDRDQEHVNTRAAQEAGVGAPVYDYRPDLGVLVIGYIDGVTLDNDAFDQADVIPRVAESCRQLHAGPRFQGVFDMFERQQSYLETVQKHGYTIPSDYLDHVDGFAEIRRALAVNDEGTVPCNNDLLAANFIDDGKKIWLIDYEYSGNNDPCFELGNIWSECRLSLEQLEELVTTYYGKSLRNKIARARLQGIVSKYGWTLWGCIQHATSPLDFDFWEWSMERYDGIAAELQGPDFKRLLEDVVRTD